MIKCRQIFLLLFLTVIFNSQAQRTAGEYLDVIGKEFSEIQRYTWEYTRSAAHGKSARRVEKRRKELVTANESALQRISALDAFNSSSRLRDSAISYLKTNYAVMNEDYAKLVDLEEISEQSYDAMEAYMAAKEKANARLHSAGEMVESEYKAFAKENNISLSESYDKISQNMQIAGEVYKYYNSIYLVFFRSYKQEAYLLEAMYRNDVNGIEQNRQALVKATNDDLARLGRMESYRSDRSLISACEELLRFYKDEAEVKLAGVSSFYVAKDNFSKLKTTFTNLPQDEKNKQEIARYNKAVEDYNTSTEQFNKVMIALNNRRSAVTNSWNSACDKFTDRHVPEK